MVDRSRSSLALGILGIAWLASLPGSACGDELDYLGVLFSQESVDVSAEVSGTVSRLHVELGAEVEKGQVLVTLESEDLRSEREQAGAAVQTARALADQARAELEDVTRLLERRRGATEIFPAEQVEGLETQQEIARTEWEAAKSTAAEREASLREIERRIAALDVRAPFTGAVAACTRDVGARVTAGEPLIRLLGTGSVWVRFAVPSHASDWLALGEIVDVASERLRETWSAEIRRIAPEIDPATDMIFVEAELRVPGGEPASFRSGEIVRVRSERS